MNDESSSTDPGANALPAGDLMLMPAIHLALAALALWTAGGKLHWFGRRSLHTLAAIFAVQAVTPFSRNQWLIDNTYQRGPMVGLEKACGVGLLAGALADRRWLLAMTLGISISLMQLGQKHGLSATRNAGRILFFGSWLPLRLQSARALARTASTQTPNYQ